MQGGGTGQGHSSISRELFATTNAHGSAGNPDVATNPKLPSEMTYPTGSFDMPPSKKAAARTGGGLHDKNLQGFYLRRRRAARPARARRLSVAVVGSGTGKVYVTLPAVIPEYVLKPLLAVIVRASDTVSFAPMVIALSPAKSSVPVVVRPPKSREMLVVIPASVKVTGIVAFLSLPPPLMP